MKVVLSILVPLFVLFSCSVHPIVKRDAPTKLTNQQPRNVIVGFDQSPQKFIYFGHGHLEDGDYQFKITGKNGRKAGEIIRASDCKEYTGIYTVLAKNIYISDGDQFSIDVWMDHIGSFTLKFEDSADGSPTAVITMKNTKINQWETLHFDFSDSVLGDSTYPKMAIFVDLQKKSTGEDEYSYFSNIYQYASRKERKKTGNKADAVKIVVLGSSTAAGTGPSNFRNAWVNQFRRQLRKENDFNEVINLAVGGYTTYQLLPSGTKVPNGRPQPNPRQNVTKALSLSPDAVIINLPSNDVNLGFTVKEQLENYRKIVKPLNDQGVLVWVSTTQPRNFDKAKQKIQTIVRDSTYQIFGRKTLDFWTDLADWSSNITEAYNSGDGVHLNDEGHMLLFAEVMSKRIVQVILDKRNQVKPTASGYSSPTYREGYVLAWHDEFDGNALDTATWSHELGNGCPKLCGWGNDEKVWYRKENTQVKDGRLIVTAMPDQEHVGFWSSSRLVTNGKKSFHFGRIDIRAKLPETQGLWPALWLLGDNRKEKGWPLCGEIDMMEEKGQIPWRVRGTIFYKGKHNETQYKGGKTELLYGNYSDKFHVYSIDWRKDAIDFLVDDVVYTTRRYSELEHLDRANNPFLKPFYLLINLAVGGNYLGDPDAHSVFPQTLEVDYVRYFGLPAPKERYAHKLMTYNIRLDTPSDKGDSWSHRKDAMVNQIQGLHPDILGIQEAKPNQVRYLGRQLVQYGHIGISRDGDKNNDEYSALFYDLKKFELLKSGTFWLSQTPEKVSKGWDAAYLRICTYGHFKDNLTGKSFWVFNTHLDNEGQQARQNGLALIQQRIKKLNPSGEPTILMGDFNVMPTNKIIKDLKSAMVDAYSVYKPGTVPVNTFNGFGKEKNKALRIDYIFGNSTVKFNKYELVRSKHNGHFISDHFPILAEATF